jgi:hypothetical protein
MVQSATKWKHSSDWRSVFIQNIII